jgi:multidrug efflux pump subunit AcrB
VNPFHGIIRAFLAHRIAPNLVAIVLCVAGLVAYSRLNTQFFPETSIPNISVAIKWPGASAQDVADGVLDRVEPELRFIQGVKELTSYATEGSARVVAEFQPGTDMDKALRDVEQRMAAVSGLPEDSETPTVTRFQFYETIAMLMLSGPFDEAVLQDYAKRVRDDLLAAGINRVSLNGKRQQEIAIDVDPVAMRQLELTAQEIGARIVAQSQNQPLGAIETGAAAALRMEGKVATAEGLASLEIRTLRSGQRIALRDVAVVKEARLSDDVQLFREGQRAILLDAERFAASDTIKSMEAVLAVAAQARATLPPTLKLEIFDVRARQIEQRLATLGSNALQGFAIVLVVLLLFLNVRVAFWVALGIPISILATFAFMYLTGQTLNSVGMVGFILVLGMLVDDAIVVGEHAQTRFEAGDSPHEAAAEGATRMFLPVIASTSTTQAAFYPIFLIGGAMGQILSAIPMVIIAALLASTLECFLTLPSHLRHAFEGSLKDRERKPWLLTRLWMAARRGLDGGMTWFRRKPLGWLVRLSYRWRYVTLALASASLILSIGLLQGGRVGFTFFPTPEPERVTANITFTPGLPEPMRRSALDRIEASIVATASELQGDAKPIIAHVFQRLGQAGQSRGENIARIDIELIPGEQRSIRTDRFVDAARRALPTIVGVERLSIAGVRGGPPGSDIDVRLTGLPVGELKRAALDLQDRLEAIEGLTGAADDLPYGKPDIILELNARGRLLGLTTQSVAAQVRAAYEGAIPMRFSRGDEEVAIRVRQAGDARGVAGLRDLAIRLADGGSVALEDVVSFREQRAFSVLQRRDGKTAVAVTANVTPGEAQADQVIAELREGALAELQAQYGFDYAFEGRAQSQREAFADLRIGVIVALTLIFLILAFVFQSWMQPILVMLIIPFGFVGAVVGHWAMGFNMALFSMIGLLGLSGVLVNGAIVLVDRMNERRAEGESLAVAATSASVDRFRALFLTTVTTVGGMAPLMLETSLQAQFLIPIAITMSFGLAFATLLVLFVTPSMLGVADDIRRGGMMLWLLLRGQPPRAVLGAPRTSSL